MRFAFLSPYHSIILSIVRIGVGLLFMQHGAQKLFGWFGGMGGPGQTVELFSQFGLAGVLELVGGALIVLGLFTRITAFLLSGEMLVAFLQAHLPQGGVPLENGGELALLYSAIFLYFVAAGPGRWSVDAMLGWDDDKVREYESARVRK
jgi:putative oxidoreductase